MNRVGELMQGERRRRWSAAALVALTALACLSGPARAATAVIDGTPLNIYADETGRVQVAFDGSPTGEFAPSSLAPANAGINIAVGPENNPAASQALYGFLGAPFTGGTTPTVTGNGSDVDPWVLTTAFQGTNGNGSPPDVIVFERFTYVNGSTDLGVQYTLVSSPTNDGVPFSARVYEAANLFVAGNDAGVGLFNLGPPRQVGGSNPAGGSARLVEFPATPWAVHQEAEVTTLFDVIRARGGFNNIVNPNLVDNAVGTQWDIASIDDGVPGTVSVIWRFNRFSALDLAATPAQVTGRTATVTVTARNSDGAPDPGRSVRYAIAGANPGAGAVTTGADGTAAISWTGKNLGTDTFGAFADINENGVREANEPERTASVTWTAPPPPPPPVPGKSVVVRVVSGEVFIKLPGSGRARATGPPKGFVPFTGAANIPVGSQLDTRKGRVALTSAATTGGVKTQTSDFYDGIFQVKQSVPKKKPKKPTALITDVVLKGEIARSQCAPLKGARAAGVTAKKKKKGPKSVLGKLWGNGKGKFRTSGKYSSATVRGTIWLVEDRCEGTFTKVRRGTVQVRDPRRKKTVTVKAGHSYLARAQRATSKSKRR
jgi:hypothetical protein